MAPKRSGKKKKKVIGTVLRSTRRIIKETVEVSVIEGDPQESTQEYQSQETEEIAANKEPFIRTIPVEEGVHERDDKENEEEAIEISEEDISLRDQEDFSKKGSASKENLQEQEDLSTKDTTGEENVQEQERPIKKEEKEKTQQEKGQERKKKRKGRGVGREREGYKRYVFKVLKQVHPELKISSMAMSIINNLMKDMFERIVYEAAKLSDYIHRTTLSSREIQDAVKLVLPGELGRHAIAEGSKAVTNYMSYKEKRSKA
ncbi:hypothetical protein JCGZ_05414 [Jatropha curcas]|uniref:Core Histone H2A/H2B/H3 domain-containing protein n=1 Tax=Jatropha curcas TaxID=180498 RepID=A0A067L694_JATCU|nr:histone H2B.2 [Jatropha curcas]KDP43947.1 hypothetical protein JCGZ_05414 [Jatropha curcas]